MSTVDKTIQYPPVPLCIGERIEHEAILVPDACRYQCRAIRLDNGMTAFLVHDPDAKTASCALNVGVGSLMNTDPVEGTTIKGLAHFLEHMLFMGTERYPDEQEYNAYINVNGGHSNAFTGAEMTNYHFSIRPDALVGGLDRFAEFFISPLFDSSCVEREMKAVHSEQQKNLQSNARQSYLLVRQLNTNEDHPAHHFLAGDMETLRDIPKASGIDIVQKMKDFHAKFYSANIMSLCIVSNHDLDALEELAKEKFTPIMNNHVKVPRDAEFNQAPYSATVDGLALDATKFNSTFIRQLPATDTHEVNFSFHLPNYDQQWHSQPFKYMDHIIGHEGACSLLSAIKREGLGLGLVAGPSMSIAGSMVYNIQIKLPNEKPDMANVQRIGQLVFASIRQLQQSQLDQDLILEERTLTDIHFKAETLPKDMDLAVHTAMNLMNFRPEKVFANRLKFTDNDALIVDCINALTVDGVQVRIIAPELKDDTSIEFAEEHFNKCRYHKGPLPESWKRSWQSTMRGEECIAEEQGIQVPKANPFVPKDLSLRPIDDETMDHFQDKSSLLDRSQVNDRVSLFFKQDNHFVTPKGSCHLLIRSEELVKQVKSDLAYHVKMRVLFHLIKEANNEVFYDALLAGFSLNYETGSVLTISANGYSGQLSMLLEKMIESFKHPEKLITEDFFRTTIRKDKANANKLIQSLEPYQHNTEMIKAAMLGSVLPWDLLPMLEKLTYEDILDFAKSFEASLGCYNLDIILGGNYNLDDALSFAKKMSNAFGLKGSRCEQKGIEMKGWNRDIKLDNLCGNWGQTNCATSVFIPLSPPFSIKQGVYINVLRLFYSQPFFDDLRTKQQLGYVVWGTMDLVHECLGIEFQCQSADASPEEVLQRMDNFMENNHPFDCPTAECTMTKDKFDEFIKSLISQFKKKPRCLNSELAVAKNEVKIDRYQFDRKPRCVSFMESDECNLEDFQNFAKEYLSGPRVVSISRGLHFVSSDEFEGKSEKTFDESNRVFRPLSDAHCVKQDCCNLYSYMDKSDHKHRGINTDKYEAYLKKQEHLPGCDELVDYTVQYRHGSTDRNVTQIER